MILCVKSKYHDFRRCSKEVIYDHSGNNTLMLTNLALVVTTRCDYHCAHCLRGPSDEKVVFPLELMPTLLEQAQPFGSIRGAGSGFGARIERIMEPNLFHLRMSRHSFYRPAVQLPNDPVN